MASISVPCPKCPLPRPGGGPAPLSSVSVRSLPPQVMKVKARCCGVKAQAREAVIENSNSAPKSSTKLEVPVSKVECASPAGISDSKINAFMAEVSGLIKLVDSRDIVELQLKQMDCEIIIRKKEALPQPPAVAPVTMIQGPQQAVYPPQPQPVPPHAPSIASVPATPTAPVPPPKANSSLPPLKCPMAGTFYRCPAPGEPPFVKVGDKVQKGQVVCIIEAMKLMNEIEADQSGTVVDILAEDGKPVSIDAPLLVIQP